MMIRQAVPEDIPRIAEIYNEFLEDLRDLSGDPYFDFTSLSLEAREAILRERFAAGKGTVALAMEEEGGPLAGFVSMAVIPCFLSVSGVGEIGYIEGAYIRKAFRRTGILRKLEDLLVRDARSRGLAWMELNTLVGNEGANASWERLGYRIFRLQWRKDLRG